MKIYPSIALIFGHFIDDIFLPWPFDPNVLLLFLELMYISLELSTFAQVTFLHVNIHNHQSPPLVTFTIKVI
jgi:hypothetical protein